MAELEREGILERTSARGFRVRGFSVGDIVNALDVRSALEGLAVRLLTQQNNIDRTLALLRRKVDEGNELIAPAAADPRAEIDVRAWAAINGRFHAALYEGADNRQLVEALEFNNRTPFVGPTSVILPVSPTFVETSWVVRAQQDHQDICDALARRESARAESLVIEHVYRTRENKKRLIQRAQDSGFQNFDDENRIAMETLVGSDAT
jgi:GntR family transcriptional regulator of vanillate catabolism